MTSARARYIITVFSREGGRSMRQDGALWVIIYVARGARQAENIEALLTAEGFLVRRKGVGGDSQPDQTFELMVLRSEAVEAQKFLIDNNL